MVKQGLKNYFKSLKYYIPSLGIMMLFFLIGVALLIRFVGNNLTVLADSISKASQAGTKTDISLFISSIKESFNATDNFFNNLITFFKPMNLYHVISEALVKSLGVSDVSSIEGDLVRVTTQVSNGIYALFAFAALGYLASYIYIKICIGKDMKMQQGLKKIILVIILGYIINITVISLIMKFVNKLELSTLIILLVTLFVNQALALFKAYLLRTQKSIKFKKIFTFKNICLLTLTSVITMIITLALYLLMVKFLETTVASLLISPIVFITLTVINLNAYEFIKDYFKVYN